MRQEGADEAKALIGTLENSEWLKSNAVSDPLPTDMRHGYYFNLAV